jgi:hypothetical protein
MRLNTAITFGITSQTLEFRSLRGIPTSGTFKVFADYAGDDDTVEFEGSVTVDTTNTTIDAASGQGQTDPHKVNLTATTGITTGRKYLISEASKREWVEPIEIVSADYIRARHPLVNAYTTAATFVGTSMTAAVDSTWVAAEENLSDISDPNPDYRVRWSYVVGGVTYVDFSYFDLVRAPAGHQVDISDLNAYAPGLKDSLPTEYKLEQGRPLLDAAWRSVRSELFNLSINVDSMRDSELLDELVIHRALVVLAMGGWKPSGFDSVPEYLTEVRSQYERFLEKNFAVTVKTPLDTGNTGAAEPVAPKPFWSK